MIQNSFIFLDKIGHSMERKIWDQGVLSWNDFLDSFGVFGISSFRKKYYDREILKAKHHLRSGDLSYFVDRLPFSEMYRLYGDFREDCVFLDIETGFSRYDVTVIGLSDGENRFQFVQGFNMDGSYLYKVLSRFKILITFNGLCFDLPVLKKRFSLPSMAHIDLRFLCSSLGYNGGLKSIEKELGIERDYGDAIVDPLYLWECWKSTRKREYLDLLLEYNNYDVENLREIMDVMYGMCLQ
ncbi:MAG: ribonuclease H-like domain-containing protein [Candidatus Woesearchaeota archaeon]